MYIYLLWPEDFDIGGSNKQSINKFPGGSDIKYFFMIY